MEIFEPIGKAAKSAVNMVAPAIKNISPSFAANENYGPVSGDTYAQADREAFNYQMDNIIGVAVVIGMVLAGATTALVIKYSRPSVRRRTYRRVRRAATAARSRTRKVYSAYRKRYARKYTKR